MASPDGLATSMLAAISPTSSALVAAPIAVRSSEAPVSIFWLTLSLAYSIVYLLQRIAFTATKFATYTLPAWLFTLFSMSLTFTMNFTTLYHPPFPISRDCADGFCAA